MVREATVEHQPRLLRPTLASNPSNQLTGLSKGRAPTLDSSRRNSMALSNLYGSLIARYPIMLIRSGDCSSTAHLPVHLPVQDSPVQHLLTVLRPARRPISQDRGPLRMAKLQADMPLPVGLLRASMGNNLVSTGSPSRVSTASNLDNMVSSLRMVSKVSTANPEDHLPSSSTAKEWLEGIPTLVTS